MGEKSSSGTSECKSCSLQPPPLIFFFFPPSDYVLGMPLFHFPGTFWQETCQQLGNFHSVSVQPLSCSSPQGVHLLALLSERFSSSFALLTLSARLELLTNSLVCPGSTSSMAQLSERMWPPLPSECSVAGSTGASTGSLLSFPSWHEMHLTVPLHPMTSWVSLHSPFCCTHHGNKFLS